MSGNEVSPKVHTRVQRVVTRSLSLGEGLQRRITYWLCHDAHGSSAGAFYIRCHQIDRHGSRVLAEAVALSGDIGTSEHLAQITFDLLTQAQTPVLPASLRYLAQDLYARALTYPSSDYSDLLTAAKSSAAALLVKLQAGSGGMPETKQS